MDPRIFVAIIRQFVRDSAKKDTFAFIGDPPGRGYSRIVADRTEWIKSLDNAAQAHIQSIIALAVHTAIFDFLCVLDGTTKIAKITEQGTFKLFYSSPEGDSLLNAPADDLLHGLYNENLQI